MTPASETPAESHLATALDCAVPLWMLKLAGVPVNELLARAGACAQVVAEKGDLILFRSKKQGETAAAFNALAEGIAVLALVAPGGVKLFGRQWDRNSIPGGAPCTTTPSNP